MIVKVKNAQNAGAVGVVVVNNIDGPPMAPGGNDASITIPVVMIRKDDGDRLFAAIGGSSAGADSAPARRPPSAAEHQSATDSAARRPTSRRRSARW